MASLFNQQISQTYQGLLKTSGNGVLTSSLAQITDGSGNGSKLYLSTSKINFYNEYEFPTTDGSANQILKTDGNGVLTWANDSVASTLNFSGSTSGTGSIALNTQTLAFTGTANQITAIAGLQAITFAFPAAGVTLPNGSIATTQSPSNNSTKVATTAYVEAAVAAGGSGNVTVSGSSVANRVAVWNNTTKELKTTSSIYNENSKIILSQPSTDGTDKFNYIIGGSFAINENDFGTLNTGMGYNVLNGADLVGSQNSNFGVYNQTALTTGSNNASIGAYAMYDNRSGNNNVGLGCNTMFNQRISNNNVAVGHDSMDGVSASQTAASDNNVGVGYQSLHIIQGGDNNTAIGYSSGSAITTGSKNVIIGSNTGSGIATSSNNIIISDGDGNNRMHFDANGKAGIGTATATVIAVGKLNVKSASTAVAHGMNVWNSADETKYTYVTHNGTQGCIGTSYISGAYSSLSLQTSEADRLTIASSGQATFSANHIQGSDTLRLLAPNTILYLDAATDIVLRTNSTTERMRISSGGLATFSNGIKFGTGTTLDKYEEGGTWTVTLPSGGTIGSIVSSRYTIIGNMCHFSFYLNNISSIPNNSSGFYISLPVTPDTTGSDYVGANLAYSDTFDVSSWLPIIHDQAQYLYFHYNDGTSGSAIPNSVATGLTSIIMSGWYYV